MTILPKWSDGMIDHYVTEKVLTQAPTYKDTAYYQAKLNKGDCFYVPADSLRQWQPAADTMAVIFQIGNSILDEREKHFQRCHSVGNSVSLDKIRFANDDQLEDGTIRDTLVLQELISLLGSDNCLEQSQFEEALSNGTTIQSQTEASLDQVAKELFGALDTDSDEEFCWSDVDSLTFEGATELTKLVNSRLHLKTDMDEKTKKSDSGKHETDEL